MYFTNLTVKKFRGVIRGHRRCGGRLSRQVPIIRGTLKIHPWHVKFTMFAFPGPSGGWGLLITPLTKLGEKDNVSGSWIP